jgi:hypothetical protein
MATRKPRKSKITSGPEPVIEATPPPAAKPGRCVVCGDEVAPFSTEELCWVCRRLKISAWRETDNQAAAQE